MNQTVICIIMGMALSVVNSSSPTRSLSVAPSVPQQSIKVSSPLPTPAISPVAPVAHSAPVPTPRVASPASQPTINQPWATNTLSSGRPVAVYNGDNTIQQLTSQNPLQSTPTPQTTTHPDASWLNAEVPPWSFPMAYPPDPRNGLRPKIPYSIRDKVNGFYQMPPIKPTNDDSDSLPLYLMK